MKMSTIRQIKVYDNRPAVYIQTSTGEWVAISWRNAFEINQAIAAKEESKRHTKEFLGKKLWERMAGYACRLHTSYGEARTKCKI